MPAACPCGSLSAVKTARAILAASLLLAGCGSDEPPALVSPAHTIPRAVEIFNAENLVATPAEAPSFSGAVLFEDSFEDESLTGWTTAVAAGGVPGDADLVRQLRVGARVGRHGGRFTPPRPCDEFFGRLCRRSGGGFGCFRRLLRTGSHKHRERQARNELYEIFHRFSLQVLF